MESFTDSLREEMRAFDFGVAVILVEPGAHAMLVAAYDSSLSIFRWRIESLCYSSSVIANVSISYHGLGRNHQDAAPGWSRPGD